MTDRLQNDQEEILQVSGLGTGYKHLQILWDIECCLRAGEWVTILGPNGAGKSTFLKAVAGLLKPFRGEIRYRGKEISSKPVHERVKMGISLVPEGRRLFTGMTVRENLMMGAYGLKVKSESLEQLSKVYDLFPVLEKREKQVVGTLSGGEQQMCAIGRALMSRPRLLLVDEPSQGLAPVIVEGLIELMSVIKREGVTLLMVEQGISAALDYTDRAYILRQGRIVKHGPVPRLLADLDTRKEYLGY